jgi:class 3 adenylate cyclase
MYRFLTTQFDYRHRGLTQLMLGGSSLILLPALAPVDLPRLRVFVTLRDFWFVVTLFIGIYVIMWAVRHDKPGSRVLAWGVLPLAAGGMLSTIRYESIWAFSGFTLFALTMAISLSRKVAGIAAEVRRSRDVFRLFVPEQLLDKIATKGLDSIKLGSAEEGTATVLFADIRSFAAIAENLPPGETLSFLNAFMQRMSPVIHAHGGFISQFVGDEIMVIFYTPEQAVAAVRCAVAMRQALAEYNHERSNRGEQPIEIGIGVNTGRVILGTIGSDTRMESCVIGDTVNLASRIQSLTKRYAVKILIAEATLRDLPHPVQCNHREVDVVQVKGISRPIAIYEIFDADAEEIKAAKQHSLPAFEKGLQLFRTRQWQEARLDFTFCADLCREDAVAKIYVQRCEEFLRTPPSAEWRGVTVLHEK